MKVFINYGDGLAHLYEYTKNYWTVHFQWENHMVYDYELYPNKTVTKHAI